MLFTLAFRHLWVRKLRSLFLLLGFSLGVGVMVVLLSVGEAMLAQSRDVSLVGGGEVTVLPLGIDVEAMRTGGLGGMFFGIDRARFLTRLVLGGPRLSGVVRAVAPAIEGKLLYLCKAGPACLPAPVRAGGDIPSRAAAVGARLDVRAGRWFDTPADSAWIAPTRQQLYDELDRFHIPPRPDSTWGEWHYFNVVTSPNEWWYITYLVGGEVSLAAGERFQRWGGRVLVTHRRPDGGYDRFTATAPAARVRLDTTRADLDIGASTVRQRDGVYTLTGRATGDRGAMRLDLEIRPAPNRYFPPVELREEDFLSGYVVPGLAATATGTLCAAGRCTSVSAVPAYHDHNWGVWRDVTWEWGAANGRALSLLYGGVYGPDRGAVASPFFLSLVDSLGVRQVLRFDSIAYRGDRPAAGITGVSAPREFTLMATRDADTVRLAVEVEHALASEMNASSVRRRQGRERQRAGLLRDLSSALTPRLRRSDRGRCMFPHMSDPATTSTPDTRTLGRALIDRFGAAWAKPSIDDLMAVFTSDAVFIETPFSEPVRGAESIRRWWLDVPYSQSEISFTSGEIYAAGPWFSTEFRCVFRRKRTGEWVDARGAIFCETSNGLISEMRMYWHRWNGGRETSKS